MGLFIDILKMENMLYLDNVYLEYCTLEVYLDNVYLEYCTHEVCLDNVFCEHTFKFTWPVMLLY